MVAIGCREEQGHYVRHNRAGVPTVRFKAAFGHWYVETFSNGVWYGKAYKMTRGGLKIEMEPWAMDMRDSMAKKQLSLMKLTGWEEPQVKLLDMVDAVDDVDLKKDLLLARHEMESLGYLPLWPDDFLAKGLSKELAGREERRKTGGVRPRRGN